MGGPTWSRATAAGDSMTWVFAADSRMRRVWRGARLLVNPFAQVGELSNAGWTLSGVTASMQAASGNAGGTTHQTSITTAGTYLLEVWMKARKLIRQQSVFVRPGQGQF